MEILFFLAGIATLLNASALPFCLALTGLWFEYSHRFLLCFLSGIFFAFFHQHSLESGGRLAGLPREVSMRGFVASIPKQTTEKTQFEFLLETPVRARVLLSCYQQCPVLNLGESWSLVATLRAPRQYQNPGSFNYLSFLQSKHISWTGFTKKGSFERVYVKEPWGLRWFKWRQSLASSLESERLSQESLGVIEALALGLSAHLSQEMWGIFRRTGTTHLMVISGAHIGLVAALIYQIVHRSWRYCGRLSAWIPAMRLSRYMALFSALAYAVLAGFAVPAERATIAFLILSLRYFFPLNFTSGQAWRGGLWFVLLLEPHAVLQPGLYLSFIAVAILISTNKRFFELGRFKKLLVLQGSCLFGLMPLTLYWFEYASLTGFFANLLAIPWVSFILIPLSLLSIFCHSSWILCVDDLAVRVLTAYLRWIDTFSWINLIHIFPHALWPIVMMTVMGLWIFVPLREFRAILLLLFVSAWMPMRLWLKPGEAEVNVLDVGQGLSVVIRTLHHTLIYDTGMKFYHGSDIGQLVLIPFLKKSGINYLDKVVISHPDLDHRGGFRSLSDAFQVGEVVLDDTKNNLKAKNCHLSSPWVWDGVRFEFFPIHFLSKSRNNHSCVLKVTGLHQEVLLAGDIESAAELYLVHHYAEKLRSSILLVPHHGSKTSSTTLFLKTVLPRVALISYGLDNRYHFPHKEAMSHYAKLDIPVYSTAAYGRLKVIL